MSPRALAFTHSSQESCHRFAYPGVGVGHMPEFGPRRGQEYPQDARRLAERRAHAADCLQDVTSPQLGLVLDRRGRQQILCQAGGMSPRSTCGQQSCAQQLPLFGHAERFMAR